MPTIAHPKSGRITLVARNFDTVESLDIQYAGGVRRPHLERIEGTRDYFSEILQPRKVEPRQLADDGVCSAVVGDSLKLLRGQRQAVAVRMFRVSSSVVTTGASFQMTGNSEVN
jgi:hypothetical protein